MRKALIVQILATAAVAFQASITGAAMSWPSVTVDIFKSNSSVLSRPMTLLETALFGSLINVGGLITAPFCGTVFNKLGRKYGCVFFGLSFLVGWAIISVTSNVTMVLVAMVLSGVGAGGQAVSPMYIAEFAEDSIRGGLTACPGTGYFFGILLCYIIGGYFSYRTMVLIQLSMSVLSIALLMTLRESPVYLVLVGKDEVGWTIIYITSDVTMVLVAMVLSGVGAGSQIVSPMFIAEFAEDTIRGGLTACPGEEKITVCRQDWILFGILLCYIIGGYFSYRTMVLIQLSMSVLSIALFMTLKESPVYLIFVGKDEDAAKSLAFYRWTNVTSKEVQTELAKIKGEVDPNLDVLLQQTKESQPTAAQLEENVEKSKGNNTQNSLISQLKFLHNSRSSKMALFVTTSLVLMSIMMGSLAVQVYAEPLFKSAVPSLSSNMCAIFLAILFLITSLLCVLLVDRCGRKMLIIVSSLGSGICTLLLGTQFQLTWAPNWFSALLIYAFSFVYTLGAAVVPFILMSEVFLPEVRGLCNSIVTLVQWSMSFIGLMLFEMLQPIVGPGPIFYAFSVVCFSCVLFTWQLLPETRGLSVDQIQVAFLKGNK